MVVNELSKTSHCTKIKASVAATAAALALLAPNAASANWSIEGGSQIDGTSTEASSYVSSDLTIWTGKLITQDGTAGNVKIDVSATDGGAAAADRLYGLDIEGQLPDHYVNYKIDNQLTITAEAPSTLGGLRGLRNVNGHLTVNGSTIINVKYTEGGNSYSTAMDTQQGSSTFNGNADIRIEGFASTGWNNALQMFGGEVNFNGSKTVLFAQNQNYTAQSVILNAGNYENNTKKIGQLNFNGGDVALYSRSPYGVNGVGFDGYIETDGTSHTVVFNNSGTALISSAVLGNGVGRSNSIGYQGNGSNLFVTDNVDEFKIDLSGSGCFGGNSNASNGTAGMSIFGSTTEINSKKLSVNVKAGQDYSTIDVENKTVDVSFDAAAADQVEYAATYGIENDVAYFLAGPETDTFIEVDDNYWNAVGILNSVAYRQNTNNYLTDSSELRLLGNVDILASGASHTATSGKQNTFGERVSYTAALSSGVTFNGAADKVDSNKYRSLVTLGSAGKTVNLRAENLSTTGGETDIVYGIKADRSDVAIEGAQTTISAESRTGQNVYGVYATDSTNLKFNAQNTSLSAAGAASHSIGIFMDSSSNVSFSGNATVTADQAIQGSGTLLVDGSLTLNGAIADFTGKIQNAGSIALGSAKFSDFKGAYSQTGGEQAFTDSTGYLAGKVTLAGGTVDVSALTLGSDTLAKTTLSGGAIAVTAAQAFGTGTEVTYTGLAQLHSEKGSIVLTDDNYTFEFAQAANASLHEANANPNVELVYLGTASTVPGADITLNKLAGTGVHAGTDVKVSSNVVVGGSAPSGANQDDSGSYNVGVRSIDMTSFDGELASIKITNGKSLTLVGSADESQQLVVKRENTSLEVSVGEESAEGSLKLGQAGVASGGTLNANVNLVNGAIAVTGGDFDVNAIEVASGSQNKVSLDVVDASLRTKLIGGSSLLIKVGSDETAGALHLTHDSKLNGATVFLDPDWKTEGGNSIADASLQTWGSSTVDGKLIAGRNSAVVLGTNDASILADTVASMGLSWGPAGYTAAAYLAGPTTVAANGALVVDGSLSEAPESTTHEIRFAANSLLVADMAKVGSSQTLLSLAGSDGSISIDESSTAVLLNVADGSTYKLVDSNRSFWTDVRSANPLFDLAVNDTTGEVTVKRQSAASVYGALLQGDKLADAAMSQAGTEAYAYANALLQRVDGNKALSAAAFDAAMNPTGTLGVFTTALDRADEMKTALRGHADESRQAGLWISLTGGKTKIDGLSTGAQSLALKTEHAGFVMGAQGGADELRLGFVLAAGTGSTRNNAVAAKDDFSNYGAALYAQRDFGGFVLTADASASVLKSDLSVGGAAQVQADATTSVYGLGLEAKRDFAIGAATLTPFVGADLYHVRGGDLATEHGASVSSADATLVQIPVGMRIHTSWTGASGLTFKPAFGVAVVPALGSTDIDQETRFAGAADSYNFTIADDVRVRTHIDFTAESESMRLGFGLGYDWGNEERSSLAAQARIDFMF